MRTRRETAHGTERLTPAPYVRIPVASVVTGYTVKAIERKIEDGVWLEGDVWRKAPDGCRLISIEGYRRWVERGQA
jgi:hypothetical protein